MPFGETLLYNASKLIEVKSIDRDFEYVHDLVKKAVAKISDLQNEIDVYVHGSYANATNIFFPSNLEVCVELKLPKYEFKMTKDYFIKHNLEYGPREFREDLFDALCDVVDRVTRTNNVAGQKCDLTEKCIIIPRHGNLKHAVEILPSVSFVLTEKSGTEFKGVMLYKDDGRPVKEGVRPGMEIATFPKLHQRNGQIKDVRTDGNFKRMVRLFKTLKTIAMRENPNDLYLGAGARGYFIECLLFNVPDNLYKGGDLHDVFLRVINYLAHASLHDFACQNLVWHLFSTAEEFWNEKDAGVFIKSIRMMYNETPDTRTELVLQ